MKVLPCRGAFAVWGSASEIPVDPKVAHKQRELGHNSTSFCIDQNSFAIYSVSWKKVFTGISNNGLNWPCKIMMPTMTMRLFFQRRFPTFCDVLRFVSNHFSSKADFISSRCSCLILSEGTCYLKGTCSNQHFFLEIPCIMFLRRCCLCTGHLALPF